MTPSPDSTRNEASAQTVVVRASEGATVREAGPAAGLPAEVPLVAVPDHALLACVGRGSYGQVWLARNVMGTYRAVKLVARASFANARPFEREFNGILKFEPLSRAHPGLVDILQVGRTEDCFYYVMELADDVATGQQIDPEHYAAKTLRTELDAHGRLPFERCLRLALALTEALGHLHAHGLIHRDIKPSNLIFVNGQPLLADIGLVAEANDAKSFVGTEGFIPPEGPGTAQADLYSLGKVLYELATGKDRHAFPELPTLLGEDSGSEAGLLELNAVILRACDPDLKRRYQSAAEMRDDLLLLQGGKSVQRAQALERRLARARRLTALALGLALLTAAAVLFFQHQARKEAALRTRAVAGERAADQNLLAARRNLYAGDMLLAARALAENNRGRALALLTKYLPENTGSTNDLRGWEWRMLWQQTRSDELFTLGQHSNAVTGIALSPDGKTLYSASTDHTVGIWDVPNRRRTGTLTYDNAVYGLLLSKDGRFLATQPSGKLHLLDTSTGTVRTNTPGTGALGFLPDGRHLVMGGLTGLTVLDPATGTVSNLYSMPSHQWWAAYLIAFAYSPDGRWMVCHPGDGSMRLFDLVNGGEPVNLPTDGAKFTLGAAFSPDGRLVAGAGHNGIAVWDVASRTLLRTIPSSENYWVASPAFSPDGRWLATVTSDQRVQLWDTRTWAEVATMRGHEFEIWAAVFTPDGSQLITGSKDGSIRVWSGTGTGRADDWPAPKNLAGALSDDGTAALFVRPDRHWELDEVAAGKRLATGGPLPPGDVPNVAVSAGGRWVAFGTAESLQVFARGEGDRPRWQVAEGPITTLQLQNVLVFSADSRAVLFANAGQAIRRLDLETGRVETLFEPCGRQVESIACSPDGRRVAAGYDDRLIRWLDRVTGEHHELPPAHADDVQALAFSPDGEFLASTGPDIGVQLWDLRSGSPRALLTGPITGFWTVAFSPDGRRFAAGGTEGQVSVWDLEQSVPLEVLNSNADRDPNIKWGVNRVVFRADETLVTENGHAVRLWPAPPLAEIDRARRAK